MSFGHQQVQECTVKQIKRLTRDDVRLAVSELKEDDGSAQEGQPSQPQNHSAQDRAHACKR